MTQRQLVLPFPEPPVVLKHGTDAEFRKLLEATRRMLDARERQARRQRPVDPHWRYFHMGSVA